MTPLFLCDHATNFIPPELNDLGLPPSELARHIAWDIGAAGVTKTLAEIFDAPAVFSSVSRLVVDCNRHPEAADCVPTISDATAIPGNSNLSGTERTARLETWFHPYHQAVESVLLERESREVETVVISIHSMTESLAGEARPWPIAISSYQDRSLADPILAALRKSGEFPVGDNQPYDLDPAVDYSVPYHAMRRGLPHLQVEFRQNEIAAAKAQQQWALVLAAALKECGIRASHSPGQ